MLVVQCVLDWLLPGASVIRDEVDQAITELALSGRAVAVSPLILHNVPAAGGMSPGELSVLNRAHADWTHRLSVVGDFIPVAARPMVHRLIVDGTPHNVEPVDSIEIQAGGRWAHPEAAAAALRFVRAGGTTPLEGQPRWRDNPAGGTTPLHGSRTTPLTSYDINRDGPFGDADPSVYL